MKPELALSKKFANILRRRRDNFSFRIESSHTCPGAPDWAVHSKGSMFYVELKSGHHVTAAQKVVHSKLRHHKIPVWVLTQHPNSVSIKNESVTKEFESLDLAVDELFRSLTDGYDTETVGPVE